MIKQRSVTLKTGAATLTYAEMGDVVVNSASSVTITLPTPSPGLWYRISNVGTGVVTVHYGSTITTLNQSEQALLLSNSTSGWWMSKGGGGVASHSDLDDLDTDDHTQYLNESRHDNLDHTGILGCGGSGGGAFLDLTDTPSSYTGQAGKVVKVNGDEDALEFGGVPVIEVLDLYATLSALQTAHPTGSAGDAYAVGTAASNEFYIWSTASSTWVSIGSLAAGGFTYESSTKELGVTYTNNTNSTFTSLQANIQAHRYIKVVAVKWYIRQTGTYTLEIINPDDNSVLASKSLSAAGTTIEAFVFSSEVEIRPGLWIFKLTRSEGATTWSDARNYEALYYNAFSVVAGYYSGSATSYCPPISLVFYDSE